jgi:Tfp pilus assembly protein PilN
VSIALYAIDRRIDGSIEDQEGVIKGLEASVAESRSQLAELSGKTRVLYDGQRPEIYWSDGLRLLSEKLPDKVWLTQLRATSSQTSKGEHGGDVVTPGGLAVDGSVLSNANEGNLDVIGKFIQDLQADPRFSESFSSITLASVQRSPEPYTLTFRLMIGFKS